MRFSRSVALVTLALTVGATTVGVQPAFSLSAPLTQVVSDNPVDNTPDVLDGTVYAIAEVGNRVVVAGSFTKVQRPGAIVTRNLVNIFAYNPNTGKIDMKFQPAVDGPVETVAAAPGGTDVIVGGYFANVNGSPRRGLVSLSMADGSTNSSFVGKTNAAVHKILVRGNKLIVGGRFTKVNDVTHLGLAVMDATTGQLDSNFNIGVEGSRKPSLLPIPIVFEMDATADGSRLIILGNFLTVNGLDHNQVAIINMTNYTVMPWASTETESMCGSSVSFFFADVEIDPTGTFFALVARGGYSSTDLCDTVTRWELDGTDTSAEPTWTNWTGGDTLWSVAVTPAAVYIAGHPRWLDNYGCNNTKCPGSVDREGIAAVDPATGEVLAWNPGRARGVGAQELVATNRGLYVGSDTERIGGEIHKRLAMFPSLG
ncbi:MAG TPA: hypothetical protein VMT88_05895 [Actinomycetes bacterium]|nr:hypothetical protein [Actinomycetes bacterium]